MQWYWWTLIIVGLLAISAFGFYMKYKKPTKSVSTRLTTPFTVESTKATRESRVPPSGTTASSTRVSRNPYPYPTRTDRSSHPSNNSSNDIVMGQLLFGAPIPLPVDTSSSSVSSTPSTCEPSSSSDSGYSSYSSTSDSGSSYSSSDSSSSSSCDSGGGGGGGE